MINQGMTCGTGNWNGPKPGDPDNFSVLSATPAFGGIDVTWTFPITNPFAVAHTILYRGTSSNFDSAYELAIVSGNFFYDKTVGDVAIEYFYWIKFVSVNGTYGELIGPASATAKPTIENMIELLTDKIDRGVLAISLKEEIDKITTLSDGLTQEATYRQEDDAVLATAFNGLQATVDETVSLVLQETNLRSSADSSLAQQITTVQSQLGSNLASVQVLMQTNINSVNGHLTAIGALYTAKVSVNGLIGGFGVYNDGSEVEAGFDVDRFWVGRTSANKRKPFIIDNGVVYIDEGAINKLTFSKLRDESGSFVVENGRVKANYLKVSTASIDDAAITEAKIAHASINDAHIKDAVITSAKIQNAAITNAKIGNLEVDTIKITNGAISNGGVIDNGGTAGFYSPVDCTLSVIAFNPGDYHPNGSNLVVVIDGSWAAAYVLGPDYQYGEWGETRHIPKTELMSFNFGPGTHYVGFYMNNGNLLGTPKLMWQVLKR